MDAHAYVDECLSREDRIAFEARLRDDPELRRQVDLWQAQNDAIRAALEMEPEDKQLRMHRMRKDIREHNIYRWAGNLITELCEVRLDTPEDAQEKFRAKVSVA